MVLLQVVVLLKAVQVQVQLSVQLHQQVAVEVVLNQVQMTTVQMVVQEVALLGTQAVQILAAQVILLQFLHLKVVMAVVFQVHQRLTAVVAEAQVLSEVQALLIKLETVEMVHQIQLQVQLLHMQAAEAAVQMVAVTQEQVVQVEAL